MPHTQRPMIHQSTYPNPSRHTQSHTHTQTQTINKATCTQTIKLIKANNSHHTHHLSHWSETHATDLKSKQLKIPKKTPSSISKCHHHHAFVGPYFGQQQVREWERVDEKTETKTKTKPKLKQHHRNKPNKKKFTTEATIGATYDQPDRSIHRFKPTNQPIQTHQQPIPTHRSKPNTLIHVNPTSKIQNPTPVQALNERDVREGVRREELWLVRDKERKWELEWERTVERIKYCF